jgi:hypothetical protein
LIQIESPGGVVIEGLRMADTVRQRQLDTVSFESCASACTLVLAAGTERYLGTDAEIGFHRSGRRFGPVNPGWSATDHKIAQHYRDRGVTEAFVRQALKPSIRELWIAPHEAMYTHGFANKPWAQRKSGY